MSVVYDSIMNLKTGSEEKLIKEKWNFLKSAVSTLSSFPAGSMNIERSCLF